MTRLGPFARRLPILVILLAALAGLFLLPGRVDMAVLMDRSADLLAFRDAHYLAAALGFLTLYIVAVSLSLPGAGVVSVTGGFLFGLFPGVLFNMAGATAGAVVVFLAARAGFGRALAQRLAASGGRAARMQAAAKEKPWSAILAMRLLPVLPFFAVNLIAASVGMRFWPFAVGTAVGILPGAVIYTAIGAGLGDVLAAGQHPDMGVILSPPILLPLIGLAILAAVPMLVAYRNGRQE